MAETPLWQVGETLRYKVYGRGILLGEQVFTIAEETWYKGSPVYHIVMEMRSLSALAIFFSYHEKDQLFLDKESLYPRYLKREIREGKNERVEETEFLLELWKMYFETLLKQLGKKEQSSRKEAHVND